MNIHSPQPAIVWRHRDCRCVLLEVFRTLEGWRLEVPRANPPDRLDRAFPAWVLKAGPWTTKRVRYTGMDTKNLPPNPGEWPELDFAISCAHHHFTQGWTYGRGIADLRADAEAAIAGGAPVLRVLPDLVA